MEHGTLEIDDIEARGAGWVPVLINGPHAARGIFVPVVGPGKRRRLRIEREVGISSERIYDPLHLSLSKPGRAIDPIDNT
jgi:hypothetical protein